MNESNQTNARTLKTRLHRYHYNLTNETERQAWKALRSRLEASKVKHFHAWGDANGPAHNFEACEQIEDVTLDLSHVFGDQWNTLWPEPKGNCNGERVHDWYEYHEVQGRKCARGHWLEITPEMEEARTETLTCGYCGKQYGPMHAPIPEDKLCRACLDSPYLKEGELYLLQLLPAKDSFGGRVQRAMSEEFRADYVSRQTTGADSRAAQRRQKQREDVLAEYERDTTNATTKRDGKLWLWDRGLDLENVIYYSHTQTFSFGWRSDGLSPAVAEKITALLEGERFPFKYEVKRAAR